MNKITTWFWGGQDAHFFREHRNSIQSFNSRVLGVANATMTIITLLYFVFGFNSGSSSGIRFSCLGCFVFMLGSYAFHEFYGKKHLRSNRIYSIVVIEIVFVFLLLVGPVYDSGNIACYLPVFFILMPLLTIENFYVVLGIGLIDFAIFGTVVYICKTPTLATYDLIDGATCFVLGIVIGHSVLSNRLSEIAAYSELKKQSETELAKALMLANRDPLTGVKSRAAFEKVMFSYEEQIPADTAEPFALVVCDVNGLKRTNDELGHDAGDHLLIECCRLICVTYAHSPVYRIGGDEFVVILRGADYDDKDKLIRQFRDARISGYDERMIAIGMSEYRAGVDKQPGEVFIRADAEMYRDKSKHKKQAAVK